MREVKLSVIVPVYNAEKYLQRCVDSILNQTFFREGENEVILIDDGSTDSSGKICDKLAKKNREIKVFHTSNNGLSEARNCGIENSSGKYIAFVDADDYVESNMYETMVEQMENDTLLDVCVCLWNFININGENVIKEENISFSAYGKQTGRDFLKYIYDEPYTNGIVISPWNKVFKRECICKFKWEGRYSEDDRLAGKIFSEKDCRITVIKERFYNYCENEDQLTKQKENIKKLLFLDILQERMSLFAFSNELVFQTQKLYEEMCIEYYSIFNREMNMDKYIKMFKKYLCKLCWNSKIKASTKVRWIIFAFSPKKYLKFILKSN